MSNFFSCDADPAALAKYVVALVKKDKPVEELKDICVDQLEVFLSSGNILIINVSDNYLIANLILKLHFDWICHLDCTLSVERNGYET